MRKLASSLVLAAAVLALGAAPAHAQEEDDTEPTEIDVQILAIPVVENITDYAWSFYE
ncbi:hypothetical protein [Nocardiopsis quinghaiensis]|uniref:hypothetical protein n=1 Tax=Nocardiopsis quinghaiensis TaxID=464995 RepID=UPI001681C008|nr:hypothetical protein [Nocardiopsis quinghaiensis]